MSKRNREHKRQRKAGKEGVKTCQMWLIYENEVVRATGFNAVPDLYTRWWFADYSFCGKVGVHCFETESEAKAVLKATLLEALKKLD